MMGDSINATSEPGRPGGGRRGFPTVVLAVLAVLAACGVPSPLYGLYEQRWHISTVTATTMYACYAIGVIAALLAGRRRRRNNPRALILAALGSILISSAIFVLVPTVWALELARVIQGFGTGAISRVAASALTALHPRRDIDRAAAAASAATAGGIGVGAAVCGVLVQWAPAPLATPYLVSAAAAVAVAVAVLRVPAASMTINALHQTASVAIPRNNPAPDQSIRAPGSLSRTARRGLAAALPLVITSWAVSGVYLALGVELTAHLLHTANRAVSSIVIVIVQCAGGIAQIGARRWPSTRAGRAGCLTMALGMLTSALAVRVDLPALFLVAAAAVGAGFGLCFLASLALTSRSAHHTERTRAVSLYFVVAYIGLSVPAILAGYAATNWGLIRAFDGFAAIVVISSLATLLAVRRAGDSHQVHPQPPHAESRAADTPDSRLATCDNPR